MSLVNDLIAAIRDQIPNYSPFQSINQPKVWLNRTQYRSTEPLATLISM